MANEGNVDGGPIRQPLGEAGRGIEKAAIGINGTVERWAKTAWGGIKQAWHFMQEHVPSWFSIHHLLTPGWIGLAAGVGVMGITAGAEAWRRRRKRKKLDAQAKAV